MMARSRKRGPQAEFDRRGELVLLELELELGTLERLQLLLEFRRGRQTVDQVVREAVRWFLAREARSIVELEAIEARRRELARLEAEAIGLTRAERDVLDEAAAVERALAIARRQKPAGGVGCVG